MFSNSQGLRHRHHEHENDPVSRSGATKRELNAPLLAEDDEGDEVIQGKLLAPAAGGITTNTPPVMVEGIEQTHNSFFCPDKTDERTVMKAVAAKTGFGFFAFRAACAFLDVLPDAMTTKLAPELSPQDRSRLHQYEAVRIIPFDATRTEHSSALSLLWSNCHRAKPLHSYAFGEPLVTMPKPIGEGGAEPGKEWQSEEWKEFGFQGVDPATDFRGGGCFSLFNLVAFSTSYPTLFRRMLYEADYPLAVAGINISMMLIHMLGLTKGRTSCLATTQSKHNYSAERSKVKLGRIVLRTAEQRVRELQAGLLQQKQSHHHLRDGPESSTASTRPPPDMDIEMERVLNEIYVVALSICHHTWMSKPTPRNIMEFNQTFPVVRTKLEQHLRGCDTLAEVILASPYPLE
jgi:hypothetical protein